MFDQAICKFLANQTSYIIRNSFATFFLNMKLKRFMVAIWLVFYPTYGNQHQFLQDDHIQRPPNGFFVPLDEDDQPAVQQERQQERQPDTSATSSSQWPIGSEAPLCSICFERMDFIKLCNSNHIFHRNCVKKVKAYNLSAECPLCRGVVADFPISPLEEYSPDSSVSDLLAKFWNHIKAVFTPVPKGVSLEHFQTTVDRMNDRMNDQEGKINDLEGKIVNANLKMFDKIFSLEREIRNEHARAKEQRKKMFRRIKAQSEVDKKVMKRVEQIEELLVRTKEGSLVGSKSEHFQDKPKRSNFNSQYLLVGDHERKSNKSKKNSIKDIS
jgi:hypothetical protein